MTRGIPEKMSASNTGAVCCKNTIVCLVDDNPHLVQFRLFTLLSLARQNLGLQHYEVLNLEIMNSQFC